MAFVYSAGCGAAELIAGERADSALENAGRR